MGWDGLYKEHPNVVGWFGRGQSRESYYEQITDRIPEAFLETLAPSVLDSMTYSWRQSPRPPDGSAEAEE